MTAWRIVFAVLAVILAGAIALDIAANKDRRERILSYEKGTYLGQPDTPMSDEVLRKIRNRGTTTRAW